MEAKKPLVIVMSRNHSTGLGVVRALGQAGYTVDLISSSHRTGASDYVAESKYVRNHVEVVSRKRGPFKGHKLLKALYAYTGNTEMDVETGEEIKIEPIVECGDGSMVLLPTDDFTLAIVDANREFLSQYFILPGNSGSEDGSLEEYMDYSFQQELAEKIGFKRFREWIVDLKKI